MSEQWYCSIGGKESGPLSAQQLKALASKGQLSPDDQVRSAASGGWVPAKRVKGLFSEAEHPVPEGRPPIPPALPKAPRTAIPPAPPPPVSSANHAASLSSPPHQVQPPPVSSSSGVGLPPLVGDFSFLEEPGPKTHLRSDWPTHSISDSTTLREPEKHKKRDDRNRRLTVVVALLVTLMILVPAVIVVVNVMNEPALPSQQAAAKATFVEKSKPEAAAADAAKGKAAPPAGNASAANKPPAMKPDEPKKWINAQDSVATVGDVEIKIQSASLGRPKGWVLPARVSKSAQFLILTLELSNHSKTRKIDYAGWGSRSQAGTGVKLTDAIDTPNNYALKAGAVGQGNPEAIYPGQSIEDKLVFERPVDAAMMLRLQLPASAFGAKGMVLFQIPREMIVVSDEEPEPAEPPALSKDDAKVSVRGAEKAAQPHAAKPGVTPPPGGDAMVDFVPRESDNRKGRSPAAKGPGSNEGAEKADRDRQTKKSDRATEAGLKEKPADKEGDNRGAGFDRANKQQSPF